MKILKLKSILFSLMAIAVVTVFLSSCEKDFPQALDKKSQILEKNFKNYELIDIDFSKLLSKVENSISKQSFNLSIETQNTGKLNFDLYDQHFKSILQPDFKLFEVTKNNALIDREMPKIHAIGGNIVGDNNAIANFLFHSTYFIGQFNLDGEAYVIEPLSYFNRNINSTKYLVYKESDQIIDESLTCEVSEPVDNNSSNTSKNSNGSCRVYNITWVLDYKFYNTRFGSGPRAWDNAVNWAFDKMWNAHLLYWSTNQYPVFLHTKAGYVYSSQNSTPASNITDKEVFKDQMKWYNNSSWFTKGDVFYMWTGSNLGGNSTIGSAESRRVCKSQYNAVCFGEYVSGSSKQNQLMAHEIGHVIGETGHDDGSNNFMNTISSKWNNSLGSGAKADMTNHHNSHSNCVHYNTCR